MTQSDQKMFCSSLTGSAAKILISFLLAGKSLDVQEIRDWTGLKRETIYDGLKVLENRGIATNESQAHGKDLWSLSSALPLLQMSEKRTPDVQMSKFRTPVLEEEVESIKTLNLLESTSTSDQMSEKRTPDFPSVKSILEATQILFGSPGVLTSGLDLEILEPDYVLGWLGLGWDQWRDGGKNGNLFAPAGMIYNKLSDPARPHAGGGFHEGRWRSTLPAEFLEALDLAEYQCDDCELIFKRSMEFDEHRKTHNPDPIIDADEALPIQGDETIGKIISSSTNTPESLWRHVLEQLEIEMPKASFDTWVRNSRVIHFEQNIITVGTRNAYAQDWMTSRLTNTVQRMMAEILTHQNIQIIFKVITE